MSSLSGWVDFNDAVRVDGHRARRVERLSCLPVSPYSGSPTLEKLFRRGNPGNVLCFIPRDNAGIFHLQCARNFGRVSLYLADGFACLIGVQVAKSDIDIALRSGIAPDTASPYHDGGVASGTHFKENLGLCDRQAWDVL